MTKAPAKKGQQEVGPEADEDEAQKQGQPEDGLAEREMEQADDEDGIPRPCG